MSAGIDTKACQKNQTTAMGSSRIHLLFIIFQLVYLVSAQEVVKRVPQGFVGMRGKKYSNSDYAELEHFFKRKPQFFVGVKGKKSISNTLESDPLNYKRAPMGFVGMRGKKEFLSQDSYPDNYGYPLTSAGSLIGKIDYSTNEEIPNSDIYIFNELLNEYLRKLDNTNPLDSELRLVPRVEEDFSDDQITNEVEKRASRIHQFYGVRGKKSFQSKRPYDLTFRGKFIGVRGKKDLKNNNLQEFKILLDQNAPWPKRKAQMGFFGMRGKKSNDDSSFDAETPN